MANTTTKPNIYRRLGGLPYLESERPSFALFPMEKEIASRTDFIDYDLTSFQLVDDFGIVVEERFDSTDGFDLYFVSDANGYIARFPRQDHIHRNIGEASFIEPLGTAEKPFFFPEGNWEICIFQQSKKVYVVQAHRTAENSKVSGFYVNLHDYKDCWKKLKRECRGIPRLGDIWQGMIIEEILQDVGRGWVYRVSPAEGTNLSALKNKCGPLALKIVDATSPKVHADCVDRWSLVSKKFFWQPYNGPAPIETVSQFYLFGRELARTFHIRDFFPGTSLRETVERNGPLDWPQTASVVKQVIESLFYLDRALQVKIMDLRPSTLIISNDSGQQVHLTEIGVSEAFMSLERFGLSKGLADYRVIDTIELMCFCLTGDARAELNNGKFPAAAKRILDKHATTGITLQEMFEFVDKSEQSFFGKLFKLGR